LPGSIKHSASIRLKPDSLACRDASDLLSERGNGGISLFFHRVSATFLSIVAVASFAAFADDPVIMACHNVNFLAKIQQVGNVSQQIFIPVYMSSAKSVDVSLSSRGLHGYVAHFSHFDPDPDTDILDVQVQVLPVGSASLPDLQTVGKIMMPYFNFSLVANVRYTQINVQANPNAGIPVPTFSSCWAPTARL
jgi:hypothetical protein